MFYLQGPEIARVRFSCERQQIRFTDWTETRDEYGSARNFTVPYGPDPGEYYYLLIDYVPDATLAALRDPSTGIADLPADLREDRIVLEITFADGRTDCRLLTVTLRDDGALFAALTAYTPAEADTFLARPDAEAIPRDVLYGP